MQETLDSLITRYPALAPCRKDIAGAIGAIAETYRNKGKLFTCGNGGSAADAEHIVGELLKGFRCARRVADAFVRRLRRTCPEDAAAIRDNLQCALPAIALTSHIALSTAYLNDVNPMFTFAQQLFGLGSRGDALLGISTSGNAQNVLLACKVARAMGIKTIGLTGRTGGRLKDVCDVLVRTPADEPYLVQEYHLPIYHALCIALEKEFFA